MLAAWKRWGFIEGIHYVVGKKPPKSFRQPIIDPKDYEHVISFYNGSVAVIISQDRPGSSNSLTLSWLLVDEAKFIDYAKLKDETLPANGGIKSYFGKHSYNHSIMILSDMPQTQKGSWFLHYRDKMDVELIKTIEATVYEIWRTKERIRALNAKGAQVPPYLKGYLRRLDRDLNKMRSVAVYYREYSSIENLQLLGENYIKQMKRDLTPLTFQTSILCQRIGFAKDGFYSSMREGHKYDANDNQYLDTLGYDYDFSTLDARADKDVDPDAPICIGMDYNANINWIVAGQPRDRRLNVIKSFYVKFENPMRHDEKYLLINQGFAGKQRLVPFFNRSNNEDLILAIQSAGVSRGRNGFRKDKSGEKLAESEEDLLEHRTDGTDAFDTLYIGAEKFPYHDSFSLSMREFKDEVRRL